MSFWRPFDVETVDRPTSTETECASAKKKMQKIKVGEQESSLVMKVYFNVSHKGWQAVLNQVKIKIQTAVPVNSPIVKYYLDGDDTVSIRRLKRIVSEVQKKQAEIYKSTNKHSSKEPAKESSVSVSKSDLEEESAQSSSVGIVETFTGKQLRYAKRKSPEERKQDKLAAFSFDSSGSDDDASSTQPSARKKKSAKESALEAQTAHTKMCEQASSTLTLMTGILQKLDNKLDDM